MTKIAEMIFWIWLLGMVTYCTMAPENVQRYAPAWPYAIYKGVNNQIDMQRARDDE